ncbi:MAG: hypothetical protein ACTSRS_04395 [Candidatus Helarchaeota archaeon]
MHESEVWRGKQSEDVRIKDLTLNLFFSWIFVFPLLIPIELILYSFEKSAILVIVGSLIPYTTLLAVGLSLRYWAVNTRYQITTRKIISKVERDGGEYEEIQLSKITRIKVKKSYVDISRLNTGSIFFYVGNKKNPQMVFKHILQVDRVYELINEIINKN